MTASEGQTTSGPLQPWLHDLVVALAAPTQMWCGPDGQIRADGAQGLYHGDIRVLSRAELRVGGSEPVAVLVESEGAGDVLAVGVARRLGDPTPDPTVRVDRRRSVTPGRLVEEVVLVSAARHLVRTEVRLLLASDLAPMNSVKSGLAGTPSAPRLTDEAAVWTGGDGLTVRVDLSDASLDPRHDGVEAVWEVDLPPGGSVRLGWRCEVRDPSAVVIAATPQQGDGQSWHPVVEAEDRRLTRWLERSLGDLEALRMATADSPGDAFLAAGAPWYLTLFGRDSLWAARMLLPLGTDLAGSTLRVLASRQGRRNDPHSAEQPGKILHEVRRPGPAFRETSVGAAGGLDLPPVYYGTVDATALWVCLLHDAWRWGLTDHEVEPLLSALEAAVTWIVEQGDEDGFLAYVDTTGHGLANQGWKDSEDSVRWRDGNLAKAPIALCEVQGYAHEAAVGGAALLEHFARPGADRWLAWADRQQVRFRDRFWVDDAYGGFPAIALDAAGRPVDSLTSNAGHLLGTGLLSTDEETTVARRLVAPEMSSGFGLRTLSAASGGFSPLSYHCGSVWPHDTAIVMAGMARAGQQEAATELLGGLLAAADAFGGRLPELYGGDARGEVPAPVPYPAACRPQAWSAAAAVAAIAAITGIRPDVPAGSVTWSPLAASPVGALRVKGLRIGGDAVSVRIDAHGTPLRLDGTHLEVRP